MAIGVAERRSNGTEDPMTDPETLTFADDGAILNSKVPMPVYRGAVPADADGL